MNSKKSYKKYEKDLLEEILKRNRRKLSKKAFRESSIEKSNRKKKVVTSRKNLSTVFKSIGYRKSYNSLGIAMNYILKNTDKLENDLGEIIKAEGVKEEFKRFNLVEDKDNLKETSKEEQGGKDLDNKLKNRQIWHCVFSLPTAVDKSRAFRKVVSKSLEELFIGHKFVLGVHSNTKNTHCHIIMKTKNDLTGKQIRVDKRALEVIHTTLHNNCMNLGIDLKKKELPKEKEIAKEEEKSVKKRKLPDFYEKKLKTWKKMYKKDEFLEIKVNEATLEKLKAIGMKDKEILSFLNMYKEDKKLAVWSVNKNPKIFNIKPLKEPFTLRKVSFTEEEVKEESSIKVTKKELDREQ